MDTSIDAGLTYRYDGARISYTPESTFSASIELANIVYSGDEGTTITAQVNLNRSSISDTRVEINGVNGTALNGTDYALDESDLSGTIYLIGDSLTLGSGTNHNNLPGLGGYFLDVLPGWSIINKGVGGRTPWDIINNYTTDVYPYHPKYAVVLMGTNGMGGDANGFWAYFLQYYGMVRANGTKLILVTIPPNNLFDASVDATRLDINNRIKAYAAGNTSDVLDVMDLDAWVTDGATPARLQPQYTTDGIHFTQAAYAEWGSHIDENIYHPYQVKITAGSTSKTFDINLLNDGKVSGTKTFNVTLSYPVNSILGTNNTSLVSITETETLTFTIAASTTTIAEADTTITLTITKNGLTDYSESVDIATADGTATQPGDYTAISSTQTFTSGQSSKTVVLSIKDDLDTEADEWFTVALSNPTGNATLGTPNNLTITIKSSLDPNVDRANSLFNMGWVMIVVVAIFVLFVFLASLFLMVKSGNFTPASMLIVIGGTVVVSLMVMAFVLFGYISGEIINALKIFGG